MKPAFQDIKPLRTKKAPVQPVQPIKPIQQTQPIEPTQKIDKPLFTKNTPTAPLEDELDFNNDLQSPKRSKGWANITGRVILAVVLFGGILYGLSFIFRGATITITPKTVHGNINQTLQAFKDQNGAGTLFTYQVMTLTESVTKQVVATKTDVVSTKASGTVVIYNNQDSTQKLIAQTRFANSKGAIFRLKNDVIIPKRSNKSGSIIPGSIEAVLIADVPGVQGNIGLSDFSVVSFTGTTKAKLIYARGKTEFSGGASGSMYFLDDAQYISYVDPMISELNTKLRDQSTKQVPEGYILLSDSLQFIPDISKNKNTPSTKANFSIVVSGKMRGILIKQIDLANIFVAGTIPEQKVSLKDVIVHGIPNLTYHTITPLGQNTSPNSISLQVSGTVDIIWNVDQQAVKDVLAGVSRKDFPSRIQAFGSIDKAGLTIKPFWINVTPKDPFKINVIIKNTATN